MRILFAVPLLLLLGACDVDDDAANDQVSIQYDEQEARNTASSAANTAQNIGGAIVNDVSQSADKVQNKVGDVDVDVDVDRNANAH
jgi:hypothetical protein